MPALSRIKTKYPGVYYIETDPGRRAYYIRYRKDGKLIEEKTPARSTAQANQIRVKRVTGDPSNRERRSMIAEKRNRTIENLMLEYFSTRPKGKYLRDDEKLYKNHLSEAFGQKTPEEIKSAEVDRFKNRLLEKRKPATVKHILALLQRIVNFGVKQRLCHGLDFKIEMPKFDNKRTEFLTPEQVSALVNAAEADEDPQARGVVLTALFTGMRRGAIFKLHWDDLDFERGHIFLREPKGGKTGEVDVIPMNSFVREVFESHPRNGTPYVFPGREGGERIDFKRSWKRIKKRAELPENFRFHGLRHAYASLLASSGRVDIYMLQRLLTHRTPEMTQRYAHLLDSALRDAAETAADIFRQAVCGSPLGKRLSGGPDRKS